MINKYSAFFAASAIGCTCASQAGLIYSTNFEAYTNGTLAGQTAWSGIGGNWLVNGTVNTGQTAFSVMTSTVGSNTSKVVRMTTEKYLSAGRSKGYLDMANSGKWATESAGGNTTLVTEMSVYVGSGQSLACSFGLLVYKDSANAAGGLFISSGGRIWTSDNGYALASRTDRGAIALDAWHTLRQEWDSVSGVTNAYVDGSLVATYTTTQKGGLYSSMLFATTDAASGGTTALNGFGYADSFSVSTVPAPGAVALLCVAGALGARRRR